MTIHPFPTPAYAPVADTSTAASAVRADVQIGRAMDVLMEAVRAIYATRGDTLAASERTAAVSMGKALEALSHARNLLGNLMVGEMQ